MQPARRRSLGALLVDADRTSWDFTDSAEPDLVKLLLEQGRSEFGSSVEFVGELWLG